LLRNIATTQSRFSQFDILPQILEEFGHLQAPHAWDQGTKWENQLSRSAVPPMQVGNSFAFEYGGVLGHSD
jgi:hypothetical protein